MDAKSVQDAAVKNFLGLNLSYHFTATLLEEGPPTRIRFCFSKPTKERPEPEIVVSMDLTVESYENSIWTYALYFEGQQYKRIIRIDSTSITGKEFNEKLIDKVFTQKHVIRTQASYWEG